MSKFTEFYFTDVHGDKELFNRAMEIIGDNHLIYGGDACDRGPHGYEIMKTLLSRPNTIYLKGNHEDMFVKAANEIYDAVKIGKMSEYSKDLVEQAPEILHYHHQWENIALSIYNGGLSTLTAWMDDGMPMNIPYAIDKRGVHFSYKKYDFCHAGCQPEVFIRNEWTDEELYNAIWDRHHFNWAWRPNRVLVHGHTPIMNMSSKYRCDRAPVVYAAGGKLNMDGGTYEFPHQLFVWNIDNNEFHRLLKTGSTIIDQPCIPMDRSNRPVMDLHSGEYITKEEQNGFNM